MIIKTIALAVVSSMLFGCVSARPQLPTGNLSEAQFAQINAEQRKIVKECRARHNPLDSEAWDCLLGLVVLVAPMGPEYSESWASYLQNSQRIAHKFERGAISEEVALERLSSMVGQLALDMQVLDDQQLERRRPSIRS